MNLIFRLLFALFCGPLFLAAGATGLTTDLGGGGDGATDGGEGAGDAGGEGDSGAGEDAGLGDAAAEDGGGLDAGAEDQNAPLQLGDGRTVPAKWRKVFEAAKASGVEKEVKQLFFGQQRLLSKFPGGIPEAVKIAETLEEYGGLAGLGELKSELDIYHQDAEAFQKDPAKWIESSFAEDSDASLKAFAHALDFVSENHAEHYDHLMAKVIFNTLDSRESPIHEIYGLLASMKDKPEALQAAQKLANFYNGIEKTARLVPEKKVDAQQAKLAERENQLNTERENLQNQAVNSQTIPLLGRRMTMDLEKEAKTAGFDLKKFISEQPGAYRALRGEILKRVMAKAASDATFKRNYRNVLMSGDTRRAADMMNKKHDAIRPDIVRAVAQEYGIVKKGAVRSARGVTSSGNAGSGGFLRVESKQAVEGQIDYSRSPVHMIMDGQAVLKNGKKVTWAR